jgi:signal transduction histidine kinase/CheY-like chemotaxis protein
MSRGSISLRVGVGSGLVALLLAAASALVVHSVQSARDAESARARADLEQRAASRLLATVIDLETGARGFVVTGRERFLEPWRSARRELPQATRRLTAASSATTGSERIGEQLIRDARGYLRFSEREVATARSSVARARGIVASGAGKRRVDAIRRMAGELTAAADAEAANSKRRLDAAEQRALEAAIGGGLLSVVLLGLLAAFLRRSINSPLERLGGATERLGAGELSARVPEEGPTEFAALAGAFNNMAASLQSSRAKLELSNEELGEARGEADRANNAKSEFLSRMSHELRTPMNAVLGFAQLLEMEGIDERQREHIHQILRSGRHLLELIDEVLDIARIEAGRMSISPEPVELAGAVDEVLTMMRPVAAQRDIAIEVDEHSCPRYARADRQRLRQVLLNLVSNGVKYNRQGGEVRIGCQEGGEGRVRVSVSDTGPGIAAEQLERLFTPFDRLGADDAEVTGTGLGLALSKNLAELMGGQLLVDSQPGSGSTFTLELDRAEPQAAEVPGTGQKPPASAAPPDELRVVYIEDNSSNLALVERALSALGEVELLSAIQGGIGVELARQHRPDVVLLDLHLPDIPGEQVLADLRSDQRTRDIPVIILSADATERQVERLLAAGAHAYLTKPIDVPEFLRTVRAAAVAPAREIA